jgi:hypothetical protein
MSARNFLLDIRGRLEPSSEQARFRSLLTPTSVSQRQRRQGEGSGQGQAATS